MRYALPAPWFLLELTFVDACILVLIISWHPGPSEVERCMWPVLDAVICLTLVFVCNATREGRSRI